MADEINPKTGQCYYAGSVDHIKAICRVLKIGDGRMSQITPDRVKFYMSMVEDTIDGYLEEYYVVPIRPYKQLMPDTHTEVIFPGKLRRLAQYWTAGLLLSSEFQDLEPNANESATSYIDDSRKELFQMTAYNQRIPGQPVYKSAVGRTMPPTMQPARMPTENW